LRKLAKDTDMSEGVHVIKFFAEWCGPCKLYRPVFERAAARHPDLNFYEVDVDEAPEMKDEYGVETVPTTVVVRDGEFVEGLPGALSSRGLDDLLRVVLS
jgi:thioredoxin 1